MVGQFVCEVGGEIDSCLRVKTFPNFQFEGVWSIESELCLADRSLCLLVWFFFYVSGGPWMSVNCNHLIRSPNSTLEFC